jgi:hypothetical protein
MQLFLTLAYTTQYYSWHKAPYVFVWSGWCDSHLILKWGGMGKCQKYLHDLSQTLTDIRALKNMNMCQILSIYLIANKSYGQKTRGPSNLERPVMQGLVDIHQ